MGTTSKNNFEAVYLSGEILSPEQAVQYTKTHESGHRYLAFRDIPPILKRLCAGRKALDYGAGTGYSSHFLHNLGFDVVGADINQSMLQQAAAKHPTIPFFCIENGVIPLQAASQDLVFSSFVLFEMNSRQIMMGYLSEARRLMKENGLFLAITGSEELHSPARKWLNFKTDFPENCHRTCGKMVRLYHYESAIEFADYYWSEADYREIFSKAGLEVIEIHHPLGHKNETFPWKDEISFAPFVILVARKISK